MKIHENNLKNMNKYLNRRVLSLKNDLTSCLKSFFYSTSTVTRH